jgi:hypothetical protein
VKVRDNAGLTYSIARKRGRWVEDRVDGWQLSSHARWPKDALA